MATSRKTLEKNDSQKKHFNKPRSVVDKPIPLLGLKKKIGGRTYSKRLLEKLGQKGIFTLADIRRKGGIGVLEGFSEKQEAAAKKLEAHAYLNLISEDIDVNEKLAGAGFKSFNAISGKKRAAFLEIAQEIGISAEEANTLYDKAKAAETHLTHLITAARADLASYGGTTPAAGLLADEYEPECEVKACNSAVSPLAYLAELLNYACGSAEEAGHIEIVEDENPTSITLEELEDKLSQPFGRFTNACEEVDRKVRLPRISVEILRRYLDHEGIPVPQDTLQTYLKAAYKALLRQVGTSYEELRKVVHSNEEEQEALAQRLGITLSNNRPNEIKRLYISNLEAPQQLNELKLERLFGLIDTTKDPLSHGAKISDNDDQIKKWEFFGVAWNRNTDHEGNIYLQTRKTATGIGISIYSRGDRHASTLVAQGYGKKDGWIQLIEKNNSGLTGKVFIQLKTEENSLAAISLIPDFLSWRLQYLRSLWIDQNEPQDPYSKGELPVIDPDVIGQEDFRYSDDTSAAAQAYYDLWMKRRNWIDSRLSNMSAVRWPEPPIGQPLSDATILNSMLSILAGSVQYVENVAGIPRGHIIIPWKETVTIENLIERKRLLTEGQNLQEQKDWVADKHLTIESFFRLTEIAEKVQREEPILEEEWQEVDSILVQVQKEVFKNIWIKEKVSFVDQHQIRSIAVELNPDYFWKSLQEPDQDPWTPTLHKLRPLIDPEEVELDELMPLPYGERAQYLWHCRKEELANVSNEIRAAFQQNQVTGALNYALGSQDWDMIINDYWELLSIDPENAKQQILNTFYLEKDTFVEDFTIIFHLWMAESEQEEISSEDLNSLLKILTSSHKRKDIHPAWKNEEDGISTPGDPDRDNSIPYWQIFRTRLPQWRSSRNVRSLWQLSLKKNSELPIIDPDLISEAELLNPVEGDKGFDFFTQRQLSLSRLRTKLINSKETGANLTWEEEDFNPAALYVDKYGYFYSGYIYVLDGSHNIKVYDPDRKLQWQWGSPGEEDHQLDNPKGITTDGRGFVYVVGSHRTRVQKFDIKGNLIWCKKRIGPANAQLRNPEGVAVDSKGNIYITYPFTNVIVKLDSSGNLIKQWGTKGSEDGQLDYPRGIAIDKKGNIWVAELQNNRLQQFNSDGAFICQFTVTFGADPRLKYPVDLAIDDNDNIYVVYRDYNYINQFRPNGAFIRYLYHSPFSARWITMDKNSNLCVTLHISNQEKNRVHRVDSTKGFTKICQETFGVPFMELEQLLEDRRTAVDVSKRLDQHYLNWNSLKKLVDFHFLLENGSDLSEEEWNEVYDILIQVIKYKSLFHNWKIREREQEITLSPDFFELLEGNEVELNPWRTNKEDRWDWEDKLLSRIDQEKSTYAAMAAAVDKVEEQTIDQLREALIELIALPAPGPEQPSISKAKYLSQILLIDMEVSPCQKTTRIATAINALQKLFFLLRNEQHLSILHLSDLQLENRRSTFDAHWRWLGSYETWRAAVGVFLYPENILIPGLRRKGTPLFKSILDNLRSYGSRFDSVGAEFLAKQYEDYFRDVCSLSVLDATECKDEIYVFATGSHTKSLYFSKYNKEEGQPDYPVWEKLLDGSEFQEINSASYLKVGDADYILLIIKVKEVEKVYYALHKFNIALNQWEDELTELKTPIRADFIQFFGVVDVWNGTPPYVAMKDYSWNNILYIKRINTDGTDWSDKEWENASTTYYSTGIESEIYNIEMYASGDRLDTIVLTTYWRGYYNGGYEVLFLRKVGFDWAPQDVKLVRPDPLSDQIEYGIQLLHGEDTDIVKLNNYLVFFTGAGGKYLPLPAYYEEEDGEYYLINQEEIVDFSLDEHPINKVVASSPNPDNINYVLQLGQSGFFKCTLHLDEEQEELQYLSKEIISIVRDSWIHSARLHITDSGNSLELQERKQEMADLFILNQTDPNDVLSIINSLRVCFNEAFYFLPMAIAAQLQLAGQYQEALGWYRSVYDYTGPVEDRRIFYGLEIEKSPSADYLPEYPLGAVNFFDPTDIHEFAKYPNRFNSYTRFTLISIIQCILAYADAEFTRDTIETIERASLLYENAKGILEIAELHPPLCKNIREMIISEMSLLPKAQSKQVLRSFERIHDPKTLTKLEEVLRQVIHDPSGNAGKPLKVLQKIKPGPPLSIAEVIQKTTVQRELALSKLLQEESVERLFVIAVQSKFEPANLGLTYLASFLPKVATYGTYGVPWNPLIQMLTTHAENNLQKIRTCRNIAGVKREIESYSADTDVLSAMPSIGPGGQLVLPTSILPPPVPYRYEFLIDRAKQLVNIAVQMEAAFLSALEKRDESRYRQLKARQDLQIARAGVKSQNLRLRQAMSEVKLANLQRKSAEIQTAYYNDWINEEESTYHDILVVAFGLAIGAFSALATWALATGDQEQGRSYLSSAASYGLEWAKAYAEHERKIKELKFQRLLSQNAFEIGNQQIKIAEDGVSIIEQEVRISNLKVDHAKDVIEFLRDKDTGAELYDWMQGLLKDIYNYFLQQATAVAKLAQNQLAFERQEPSPGFIQHDYWEAPSDNPLGGSSEESTNRFGLTGSARLLADIYKLDQYRLETEKRKLHLSKNISLARVAPFEFQQFRESGVLTFSTVMDWFDRDFPGHYLRMIKRVRTSVIALVPPVDGIKATLTNIGVSRIVTERNGLFSNIIAYRPPESVALTSPANATGLFELESQDSSLMLPFEGLGLDTLWEFRMPKAANQFDYSTIADVILSIDFTALHSYDYQKLVIESLPSRLSGDRPFSFRHQFADAWYDLHNPDPLQSEKPIEVFFKTRREDFPLNLERVIIRQILLYFVTHDKSINEQEVNLTFTTESDESADLGGIAKPVDGIISTLKGNGSNWLMIQGQPVSGTWTLSLPNTPELRRLFEEEKIEDILLVITFAGMTPKWPG